MSLHLTLSREQVEKELKRIEEDIHELTQVRESLEKLDRSLEEDILKIQQRRIQLSIEKMTVWNTIRQLKIEQRSLRPLLDAQWDEPLVNWHT